VTVEHPICGAIILAAGLSQRMGDMHKLLAPLGEKTVIAHSLTHIQAAGFARPIVVIGARAEEMRAALQHYDVHFVEAEAYQSGLAHSLAAGLHVVPHEWRAALICLGDMPFVTPATLRALAIHPADQDHVVVPTYQGQRGNPVRWGRAYFAALSQLQGDVGGKTLFAQAQSVEWPCNDQGIIQDIDTPEALAQARAFLPTHSSSG